MTAEEKLTKAVTPQVLEDYHNTKVAPFLNPAIQYFGKSDVYSTSERWIGQWIDRKPLYQKVVTGTTTSTAGSFVNYPTGISGAQFVEVIEGRVISGTSSLQLNYYIDSNNYINTYLANSGEDIKIKVPSDFTNSSFVAVLRYTKSADSAISVPLGDPNEYTTDERWVGMWMGQPLYQKTVDCGALPNGTTKTINHGISSIDKVVEVVGSAFTSTGGCLPIPYSIPSTSASLLAQQISVTANRSEINIQVGTDRSSLSGYVTLRYTKTS